MFFLFFSPSERPLGSSPIEKHWVPSHKAAAHFGSSGLSLLCAPGKWGKKKEKNSCLIYMLSGIALSAVHSPTVPSLEHDLFSLATLGTEACDAVGDAFRPQWRERAAKEVRRISSQRASSRMTPVPPFAFLPSSQAALRPPGPLRTG